MQVFCNEHERFSDKIVRLRNMRQTDNTAVTVYAVLLGIGQHLQHYDGFRKSPNARLVFASSAGFNHGSLKLVSDTKNGVGIRADKPIVVNFGVDFTDMAAVVSSPSKKVRGPLDLLWEKYETALPEDEGAEDHDVDERIRLAKKAEQVTKEAEAKRKAEEDLKKKADKKEEEVKKKGGAGGEEKGGAGEEGG